MIGHEQWSYKLFIIIAYENYVVIFDVQELFTPACIVIEITIHVIEQDALFFQFAPRKFSLCFQYLKTKRLLQMEKSANCSQQFHAFFWATSFPGFPFSSLPSSRTRLPFGFLVIAERHSRRGAPYLKENGQETYLSQKMCL